MLLSTFVYFCHQYTEFQMTINKSTFELVSGKSTVSFEKPVVMGILNLTPDSFYKNNRFVSDCAFLDLAEKMLKEGAQILDIGGISTRPGSIAVSEEEELRRLIEPLKSLVNNFPGVMISVDTFRNKIAKETIGAGAHMINDVSGGTFDIQMANRIAQLQVPYVMMHMQGTPQVMQKNPQYENVVHEVSEFFKRQLNIFRNAGVQSSIILDPGFGFGKNLDHNFSLLAGLEKFHQFKCPLLVGVSRKSMINKVLQTTPEIALNGTTVLNTLALMNGANILRVHDVKEAQEAVLLVERFLKVDG